MHDLLVALPEFENVQYNILTNASDYGRDVEADKVTRDSTGRMDVARTIIQCKLWKGSLKDTDISNLLTRLTHIEPPPVRELIIAFTSGITHGGQEYVDRHNREAKRPRIDLWSPARLETILNQYPDLITRFGLR